MSANRRAQLRAAINRAGFGQSGAYIAGVTLIGLADPHTGLIADRLQPTLDELAAMTGGMPMSTLTRSLRHLERHGWLTHIRGSGPGNPNRFEVAAGQPCDCRPRRHRPATAAERMRAYRARQKAALTLAKLPIERNADGAVTSENCSPDRNERYASVCNFPEVAEPERYATERNAPAGQRRFSPIYGLGSDQAPAETPAGTGRQSTTPAPERSPDPATFDGRRSHDGATIPAADGCARPGTSGPGADVLDLSKVRKGKDTAARDRRRRPAIAAEHLDNVADELTAELSADGLEERTITGMLEAGAHPAAVRNKINADRGTPAASAARQQRAERATARANWTKLPPSRSHVPDCQPAAEPFSRFGITCVRCQQPGHTGAQCAAGQPPPPDEEPPF